METLFELLVPLLFIAVILIVNILARVKEAQKGPSGERREATPWTRLAGPEQIRKFLEDTTAGTAAKGPQQDPQPAQEGRTAYGGPTGMPAGRVTPTARRRTTPTESSADQARRREARHLRTPPPPPEPAHVPVEKRQRKPRVRSRASTTEKSKFEFEGGLEKRMASRDAKRLKGAPAAGATIKAGVTGAGEATQAAAGAAETTSTLLPKFSRGSLRRAIVMSEVLATPVGLRPPRV